MTDLVEFLRARLDEDEAAAKSVPFEPSWTVRLEGAWQKVMAGSLPVASGADSVLPHIARHDPARVLREVEAKRLILAEHTPEQGIPYDGGDENDPSTWVPCCSTCQVGVVHEGDWPCLHLRLLALPDADHEDYLQEWKP